MKKIFIFIAAIALSFCFSVGALAADTDTGIAQTENTAYEALPIAEDAKGEELSTDTATDNEGDSEPQEDGGSYNIFALAFEKIGEYSGEIFCALTLVGTAILSFAYKKGLLPLIKGSLSAIGGAVGSLKENAEQQSGALSEKGEKMLEYLGRAEEILADFTEKLSALECKLSGIEGLEKSQSATEIILKCQIDALSEIFMSSSLPEYRKAALGEKLTKMREALKNVEITDKCN